MQQAGLDLQQAPPIRVPFKFFLTAAVFALLASMLMLWQGPDIFASRWSQATLAAVHLVTLGSMTMVMAGAMMQMLPVLAGVPVPRATIVAALVHPALIAGTLLFAAGFLFAQPLLLKGAIAVLAVGITSFLIAMILALARVRNRNATVYAMSLAIGALAITAACGLTLASSRAWGTALPSFSLRDLHPAWGLMGWTGLLVAGVAYQVVPMFQITPNYPRWLMRGFTAIVFVGMALYSILRWQEGSPIWLSVACMSLLVLSYLVFAGATLNLQRQRRRRLPDVTLEFWRTGMIFIMLAALLWLSQKFPMLVFPQAEVLLGVFMILGVAMSFIIGMLCKIVPFLSWFHLQAMFGADAGLPNVKAMLPEKRQRLQLQLHQLSMALCIAAALWPSLFAHPAALAFGATAVTLLLNIMSVTRRYRDFIKDRTQGTLSTAVQKLA
ncbi:MAG TPA: permease [Burkholderiaceae bacterium]|nr:permease [Burkholderiaceae bacterium]